MTGSRTVSCCSTSQTDTHVRLFTGTIDELMVWNREVAVNGMVFTIIFTSCLIFIDDYITDTKAIAKWSNDTACVCPYAYLPDGGLLYNCSSLNLTSIPDCISSDVTFL
jgi:hypothetical protein